MRTTIKPNKLKFGDTIGVIAPSRPIYNIEKEIKLGIKILESLGFNIKLSKNLYNHHFYSAGTAAERARDFNQMITDKEVSAIICATGGASSAQILPLIDYGQLKMYPKIIIGYSDNTALLLAINKKTGLVTFHGPDLSDLKNTSDSAIKYLMQLLTDLNKIPSLPNLKTIIKEGSADGRLIGGNIYLCNSILASSFSPDYRQAIWFWEEVGASPAQLDQELTQFKLSGNLEKITAIIIGNLSECQDKKYPQDNRAIKDIIIDLTRNIDIPIVTVDFFGHDVKNFYTLPIGIRAIIDTDQNKLELLETAIK